MINRKWKDCHLSLNINLYIFPYLSSISTFHSLLPTPPCVFPPLLFPSFPLPPIPPDSPCVAHPASISMLLGDSHPPSKGVLPLLIDTGIFPWMTGKVLGEEDGAVVLS